MLNPQISPFEGETGFRFLTSNSLKKLRIFRDKIADSFFRTLPYPESDLLSGIVLGIKKNLDPEFYSQLRSTGTLHIIVASGYNLSLIGKKPINFLSYLLGRELAIIFSFLLIWLYVGIVGFEPPIIRAAIMVSFLFLAQLFGRRFSQWRALFLSIWLMLIFKPDLIVSVSFQLSIAALVGIILGEKLFKRLEKLPFLGPELAETLSAQIMVLPIISWHFGRASWLSPLANILILPIIPYLTGIGFLSLFFLWWPFLSRLLIWGPYPLLWWSILVTKRLSGLPTAEFSLKITGWQTVFLYLVFFFLFRKFSSKKGRRVLTKNSTRLSSIKSRQINNH